MKKFLLMTLLCLTGVSAFADQAVLRFTINPPRNGYYPLPFVDNVRTGDYTLRIDWGDGSQVSQIEPHTLLKEIVWHQYAYPPLYRAQYRTITITSSQHDPAREQMPPITFSRHTRDCLISIDTPLPNTGATSFEACFYGCQLLSRIPSDLFINHPKAENFAFCFMAYSRLDTIPDGLFDHNPLARNFSYCFSSDHTSYGYSYHTLKHIPENLFAHNPLAEDFSYCFYGCWKFESIPEGLFAHNARARNFSHCFALREGSALTSIPEGLFAHCPAAEDFSYCFSECGSVTSLPEKLFAGNPAARNFSHCFERCYRVSAIPEKLFAGCKVAESFSGTFQYCRIGAIPGKLFAANPAAKNFANCFRGCRDLTSIPAGVFAHNRSADNFNSCFMNCEQAIINPDIFCHEATEKQSRFAGMQVDLHGCFSDVAGGTAPALWEYPMEEVPWSFQQSGCFAGSFKLTNWDRIPPQWRYQPQPLYI